MRETMTQANRTRDDVEFLNVQVRVLGEVINDYIGKLKEARKERDEYRSLRDSARDEAYMLRELLNAIHADLGRRREVVGTEKAVQEAVKKIAELRDAAAFAQARTVSRVERNVM